ncbi:hypothetical protein FACS1894200_08150 [Spirochaetia bacterium]|nr:hypothetical protein FACS1894200_08150 [Spirochaetia bacterium]
MINNQRLGLPSNYKAKDYSPEQTLVRNAIGFCYLQDSCNVDFKKTDIDISVFRKYLDDNA